MLCEIDYKVWGGQEVREGRRLLRNGNAVVKPIILPCRTWEPCWLPRSPPATLICQFRNECRI